MDEAPMLRAVWSAIGLLGLLSALVWWVRRKAPGWAVFAPRRPASEQAFRRLAKLVLTPQHALHIVEWQGHQWLIGTGAQGLIVHSIPAPGEFPLEMQHALSRPEVRSGESSR